MDIIPQWFPIPLQDQTNHGHHSSVIFYTFTGPDKSWTSFLSDFLYLYRTRQIMDIIPQWFPIPLQDQTNHGHHSSVISYTFTGPEKSWTSFLSDFLYLYRTRQIMDIIPQWCPIPLYNYRTRQIMDIIPQWCPIPLQDQTNHGHHSSVMSYTFTGPDKSWTSFLSDFLYLYRTRQIMDIIPQWCPIPLYNYRTRQIMDIIPQWCPIPLQDQTNHGHHSSVMSYTFTGPDKSWTSFLSDFLYLYRTRKIMDIIPQWCAIPLFMDIIPQWCPIPLYNYRTRQIMDIIPQWCPIPLQDQINHGHHSSVISYTFTGPDKSWTSFLSDVLYLYIITGPDKSWTSFLSDVLYLYRTRQIMDIIPQWCPIPLQDQTNHGHHSSVISYTFTGPDKSWTSFLSDVLYLYRTRQIMDIIPQWFPIPLQDQKNQIMDIIPQWCPIPLYNYRTRQIMDIIPQWCPIPLQDQTNHGHHSSVMSYTFTGPDKSWTSFLSDIRTRQIMDIIPQWCPIPLYNYRTRQIMDIIPQWCPIPLQDQTNHGHHSSVISYTFTGPGKSWTSFLSDVLYLYIITGPDKSWTSFLSDVLYLYRTR